MGQIQRESILQWNKVTANLEFQGRVGCGNAMIRAHLESVCYVSIHLHPGWKHTDWKLTGFECCCCCCCCHFINQWHWPLTADHQNLASQCISTPRPCAEWQTLWGIKRKAESKQDVIGRNDISLSQFSVNRHKRKQDFFFLFFVLPF